jgi:hypothetical protein
MKILSIDVGIKNLALCLIEKKGESYSIYDWCVINLCNENKYVCDHCKKKACLYKTNCESGPEYYCKIHAKKSNFKIPTSEDNLNKIKKLKINDLCQKASEYNITFTKPIHKEALIYLIQNYLKENYLDSIVEEKTENYNLVDLGINLKERLEKLMIENAYLSNLDAVIIENQISPLANRMKTLQGMIAQFFIMKGIKNIEFISSVNKLKEFVGSKKTSYNERKKLSVEITPIQLEKLGFVNDIQSDVNWIDYFNKSNKKDDLADCFLQALYYLHN